MNQFKDVFTGSRKVSFSRAVTSQKCIRAGGKHNDLENVGHTGRHQTFFEMLGNFSFGDYFKEEAINFAWEWVTKTLGLSPSRLYATVYEEDDEAFALWEKIAPELKNGRILRFGKKDNFWSMGEVGPCGPCSELHYDMGEHLSKNQPEAWVNSENERYVEIWNLVFMQYDQIPGDPPRRVPLPKPSVDTGAGLERIAAVMQGVDSNYETDLFRPLTAHVADITGVKYIPGPKGSSHRVIADHVRALSFALADGGGLSNEGRGYVLRRILRRGARHGRLLGYHQPILCQLVPTLIDIMGKPYPELVNKRNHIEAVIKAEEERFGETLDTGLELFSNLEKKVKASGSKTISGEDIFKLYDTYGFPVDMTATMAEEAGLTLDMAGFEKEMATQQEQSRARSSFGDSVWMMKDWIDIEEKRGNLTKTVFIRGDNETVFSLKTSILACTQAGSPNDIAVILRETPFYAGGGGQTDDLGIIENSEDRLVVTKLEKYKDYIIHKTYAERGSLQSLHRNSLLPVTARIDIERRKDIMRNHTATHLLHKALRMVLGDHVKQSGSLVEPERLRFDFAHYKARTPEEIAKEETIDNEKIQAALKVNTVEMPVDEAMKSGAMALFDEKYGDTVRVVSVGDFSKELCGGTHVSNSSEIGLFIIGSESAIASGVRRIEAITGRKAAQVYRDNATILASLGKLLNAGTDELTAKTRQLVDDAVLLQKEVKKLKAERYSGKSSEAVSDKRDYAQWSFGTIGESKYSEPQLPDEKIDISRCLSDKRIIDEIKSILNVSSDEIVETVNKLAEIIISLQDEIKELRSESVSGSQSDIGTKEKIGGIDFVHWDFGKTDQDSILGWTDVQKGNREPVIAVGVGVIEGKRTFIAAASKASLDSGVNVGKIVGEVARELGGRGGGKADFARGGLPETVSYDDFVSKIKEEIKKKT